MRTGESRLIRTVCCDMWAIYIDAVLPMFRAGHPPLFIPWGDFAATAGRTLIFRWVELSFAQCPGPTLRISRHLAEALARESNGRLRLDDDMRHGV